MAQMLLWAPLPNQAKPEPQPPHSVLWARRLVLQSTQSLMRPIPVQELPRLPSALLQEGVDLHSYFPLPPSLACREFLHSQRTTADQSRSYIERTLEAFQPPQPRSDMW